MPRNDELNKILLIGSGPIVIGQGCEFDYSGVQACKALREEGYEVVLVNSNPATIMTDPEFADRSYTEPITAGVIEAIMERERPDAILPTLGGQTALNAAMELKRNGALARHGVKLIGANAQAIAKGEDRQLFNEAMLRIGLEVPRSGVARSLADLDRIVGEIGTFPLIIRPAFTLGGTGGGIAYNREELDVIAVRGLDLSPVHEVLIEESLVGWKEFEMEVMRDRMDNCVVVCSIENFDPMGVHTGDSITVAPVQTLTDKEYQMMRDAAFAVIREIGVETGGSNIQFAVHPENGRMVVIEMNPRVSRSSALASKATGFPIAKIAAKLAVGYTLDEIKNDKWFLRNIADLVAETGCLKTKIFSRAKKLGFSDRQLAVAQGASEETIRSKRKAERVAPTYRLVDTCAAEFEAYTPYYYSTYGDENERRESGKRKIMILGGGPNRIGQGIEFDYCCVHAAFALRELEFETIMVNSNPETVSTDYDTSDKLYFEPLTLEDVLNIYDQEKPEGVLVQFGGQTPLNLSQGLKAAGVSILGTQPESIETAEDRKLFAAMLDKLGLRQTPNGSAVSTEEAVAIAQKIGYPVLVRPSFVLGGRAMELVYNEEDLRRYMASAIEVTPDRPVLIDRFLEDAVEVDVDCIADGEITVIGAIMEHIEEAGIHSGDSACVIPTFSLSQKVIAEISAATKAMARALNVHGLMNVQFAVKGDDVYVLEVNPRASRTIPFVSKAIGVPLAKLAAKVMVGRSLRELGFTKEIVPKHFSVKEAVFPFLRYEGLDISLGPEMKSTGEVMGMDVDLGLAYAKSQMAAPPPLPKKGKVFISVKDTDKEGVIPVAREFVNLGFEIISTSGTADALTKAKIKVTKVFKIHEGRPNVLDRIKNGDINFIINTPSGTIPREHEVVIRNAALAAKIPIMTTVRAALASANGIRSLQKRKVQVRSLQEYHAAVGGNTQRPTSNAQRLMKVRTRAV